MRNLLLDLGGVLLTIDYSITTDAFHNLGYPHFDHMYSQYQANVLFEKLETGHISEEGFHAAMRAIPTKEPEEGMVIDAWNAMLLDFRKESLQFLEKLAPKYNLFLLSNTNIIHKRAFDKLLEEQTGYPSLDVFFKKAYYSHLVGMRKPNPEIFQYVLSDSGLQADETLFIDDSINNIEAAEGVGIKTLLLKPGETIEDKLSYLISS